MKKNHEQKHHERTSIQCKNVFNIAKVSEYLKKKGIKLTFLIKKEQL